jgi:fibro-slime domain-containing protein
MVWSGGASRGARHTLGTLAVVSCFSSSCGGRSSLFALGTGGGAGASGAAGGGSGTGGSSTGAGGLVTGGSAGSTSGTGGVSATGGTGGSGGIPSLVEICGDALRSLAEECDDGNRSSGDGCSIACRIEPGATCVEGRACTFSICGNGVIDPGELCDLGAANGTFYGDRGGCSHFCTPEPDCRSDGCEEICGDGNVDPGEPCDDGNRFDRDGCSAGCELEPGFTCVDILTPDGLPCAAGDGACVRAGIIYRDFDPLDDATPGGHPDFYFLGASRNGTTLDCVPDSSGWLPKMDGDCFAHDSTSLCQGQLEAELSADARPISASPLSCACRFTDRTGTGLLTGAPGVRTCRDANGREREWIERSVPLLESEFTFGDWFSPSEHSHEVRASLELRSDGTRFEYSSGNGVDQDLHAIFMGEATTISGGFFPLEFAAGRRVCNLWPYFLPELSLDCAAGPGRIVPNQWDPRGSDVPFVEGSGGVVAPVAGVLRNFYFTSEAHLPYRYSGAGTISFFGDDDLWVFLNRRLILDMGGTHGRLLGTVGFSGGAASWNVSYQDPTSLEFVTIASGTFGDLKLEQGRTYDLAVFHANRSPRDSNYELALTAPGRVFSSCSPTCGDGIVTVTEECDLGSENTASGYGGCTLSCFVGPYCGDSIVNREFGETCDLGDSNSDVGLCTTQCALHLK